MQPPSSEELADAIRRYADQHGKRSTLAVVYDALDLSLPGRPLIMADPRHLRMSELLASDPELIRRRAQGDHRLLFAAARKAILENPGPKELDKDGKPDLSIVQRLVRTMPKFRLSDDSKERFPEQGFDGGLWLA